VLKAKGIDTVLREADMGRIYGATFIDHNTGCVLNGSRLGKELSANALQEHFATEPMNKNSFDSNGAQTLESKSFQEQEQHFSSQNDFSEGSLGLLSFDAQDTNTEEEALMWKMKRKKKKKQQRKM
jgi:hypothetical protein